MTLKQTDNTLNLSVVNILYLTGRDSVVLLGGSKDEGKCVKTNCVLHRSTSYSRLRFLDIYENRVAPGKLRPYNMLCRGDCSALSVGVAPHLPQGTPPPSPTISRLISTACTRSRFVLDSTG